MIALINEAKSKCASKRAREVVLTTAIFDEDGRILVTSDGLLPHRKITHSFIEQVGI